MIGLKKKLPVTVNLYQRNLSLAKIRGRAKLCLNCNEPMIKFGGTKQDHDTGGTKSFVIGRICKRCGILYINPKYKDLKVIYHNVGGREMDSNLL